MKPGDIVANKHTGVRFVIVRISGNYAHIQTKPGQRTRIVPLSLLKPC